MDVLENADGVVDYNPVVIASSHANDNSDYGMYLINAGNTVAHSQANNNGLYGMALWGGDNSVVDSEASNNKASNGGGGNGGITLGGVGNSVIGTTANNNVHTGIALNCPSDLYGNTASGNGSGDIVLAPISKGCARLDNHPSP
jgi:hypothetical protein